MVGANHKLHTSSPAVPLEVKGITRPLMVMEGLLIELGIPQSKPRNPTLCRGLCGKLPRSRPSREEFASRLQEYSLTHGARNSTQDKVQKATPKTRKAWYQLSSICSASCFKCFISSWRVAWLAAARWG